MVKIEDYEKNENSLTVFLHLDEEVIIPLSSYERWLLDSDKLYYEDSHVVDGQLKIDARTLKLETYWEFTSYSEVMEDIDDYLTEKIKHGTKN